MASSLCIESQADKSYNAIDQSFETYGGLSEESFCQIDYYICAE